MAGSRKKRLNEIFLKFYSVKRNKNSTFADRKIEHPKVLNIFKK